MTNVGVVIPHATMRTRATACRIVRNDEKLWKQLRQNPGDRENGDYKLVAPLTIMSDGVARSDSEGPRGSVRFSEGLYGIGEPISSVRAAARWRSRLREPFRRAPRSRETSARRSRLPSVRLKLRAPDTSSGGARAWSAGLAGERTRTYLRATCGIFRIWPGLTLSGSDN